MPAPRSVVVSGLVSVLVSVLTTLAPAATAHAVTKSGPPGAGKTGSVGSSPIALSSESSWSNPNTPGWCKAEDDYDYRTFSGSLNGTYSTSYQLCNPSVDYYNGMWWDAGGEGLEADIYEVGQMSSLIITAPDGTTQSAVLMGQSVSKGVTTYHYAVCYVPPYYLSSDTSTSPLAGGTWQVALTGQISSVTWTTRDDMTDVTFQHTYCPTSEQNLR